MFLSCIVFETHSFHMAEVSVPCVAEGLFQLANNHNKNGESVNLVNISKGSDPVEINCCCYSFKGRIASCRSQVEYDRM